MNHPLNKPMDETADSRITILLIEDNPGDARLFQEMMKEAAGDSCRFFHADRLSAGLVCLAGDPMDAVLLDLGLPDSQGIDTFLHLQKAYPHVPVIVLTGRRDNGLAIQAVRQGAQDYLVKEQVNGDLLFRSICYAIERKLGEIALQKSEEKYRNIVENAAEGIYQVTADSFITVNQAFADMLGYQSSEELMKSITDISHQVFVDPEVRLKLRTIIEEQGSVKAFETELYRKDGRRISVSINTQAVKDDQGGPLYHQGICTDITEIKAMDEERRQNLERMRKALEGTVQAIAALVETRDPYTAGHQHRVADLARALAAEMGLAPDQIEGLRMASTIHDIGKISIPAEIISMPKLLTEIEYSLIKIHPRAAYDILKDIDFPWPIARMVLEHHERMDGSGYPQGLSGEQILLEARIIAIADVVEAIASHRPYRPAHGIDAALDEISKNKGLLYDPVVTDACLTLFREKVYGLA